MDVVLCLEIGTWFGVEFTIIVGVDVRAYCRCNLCGIRPRGVWGCAAASQCNLPLNTTPSYGDIYIYSYLYECVEGGGCISSDTCVAQIFNTVFV